MTINNEHRLEGDVNWERSPNHSGLLMGGNPDTIIIHYTGGPTSPGAVQTLTSPHVKASAHLVIGRGGNVFQLVPFDTIAWHAGRSAHEETGRKNINKYAIGIELVNAGPLEKVNEEEYIAWFGRKYDGDEVIYAQHKNELERRYWHLFTEAQLLKALEICRLLTNHYPIKYVLGHDEIAPGRKTDPGPAFPMNRFRDKVLNLNRDVGAHDMKNLKKRAVVNAYYINIRSGPSVKYPRVAEPLEHGTKVVVQKTEGKWCKVKTERKNSIEGWVNGKYLSDE